MIPLMVTLPTPHGAPANESELQVLIANVFIRHGLMVIRNNSGSGRKGQDYIDFYRVLGIRDKAGKERRINAGRSDLSVGRNGFFVEVEAKMPGEPLRKSQVVYQSICRHFNIPYEICYSVADAEALVNIYWFRWGLDMTGLEPPVFGNDLMPALNACR